MGRTYHQPHMSNTTKVETKVNCKNLNGVANCEKSEISLGVKNSRVGCHRVELAGFRHFPERLQFGY